jgi:hypothetical protein
MTDTTAYRVAERYGLDITETLGGLWFYTVEPRPCKHGLHFKRTFLLAIETAYADDLVEERVLTALLTRAFP